MLMNQRMKMNLARIALAITLLVPCPLSAHAHFVWLFTETTEEGKNDLYLSFAEGAIAEGADLLDQSRLGRVVCLAPDGSTQELQIQLNSERQVFEVADVDPQSIFVFPYEYGLFSRGEESMKLCYYSMAAPGPDSPVWKSAEFPASQKLLVVPSRSDAGIRLAVLWRGEPLAGSEVVVEGPTSRVEVTTGKDGYVDIESQGVGVYEIRARNVEAANGIIDGKEFSRVTHYATLTFPVGKDLNLAPRQLPSMPHAVTSFGATLIEDRLYVYGGHHGEAHHYTAQEQGRTLHCLDLRKGGQWESVAEDVGMQGLALVGHGGNLYRIGGLQARNDQDADHDLWSLDAFLRFNVANNEWETLPDLPEPRSSFDATVMDNTLYIAGGWTLKGHSEEESWLKTAYKFDLGQEDAEWIPIAEPPFERRAVATAVFDGKLFVVGGMSHQGGPLTSVDIYDPIQDEWESGPALPGDGIEGFGTAAVVVNGELYATTMNGNLHRLRRKSTEWELVCELSGTRFFHRMVAVDDRHLLLIGGADMEVGKFDDLEWIDTAMFARSRASESRSE